MSGGVLVRDPGTGRLQQVARLAHLNL